MRARSSNQNVTTNRKKNKVNWNSKEVKGFENGRIISHEGKGRFWIEYDQVKDENNSPFILENLLYILINYGKPPKWEFL